MQRPEIIDSISATSLGEAVKIYEKGKELFNHIQKLDAYIDYLEDKLNKK